MKLMKLFFFLILGFFLIQAGKVHTTDKFIFSHGFGSTSRKKHRYINQCILPAETIGFDYQDARIKIEFQHLLSIGMNTWDSCLGQQGDIQRFADQIKLTSAESKLILFGESRGASAIVNYLGSQLVDNQKIKAVVLDSPFDSLRNVLDHRLKVYGLYRIISLNTLENLLLKVMHNYSRDDLQSINSILCISTDIPILYICSEQDSSVCWKNSATLYNELLKKGSSKVHIFLCPVGKHGHIMEGKAKELYRNVTHAFYKKYGVEHNMQFAEFGEKFFNTYCQPTSQEIEKKINDAC